MSRFVTQNYRCAVGGKSKGLWWSLAAGDQPGARFSDAQPPDSAVSLLPGCGRECEQKGELGIRFQIAPGQLIDLSVVAVTALAVRVARSRVAPDVTVAGGRDA